jgi:hypothetical protein
MKHDDSEQEDEDSREPLQESPSTSTPNSPSKRTRVTSADSDDEDPSDEESSAYKRATSREERRKKRAKPIGLPPSSTSGSEENASSDASSTLPKDTTKPKKKKKKKKKKKISTKVKTEAPDPPPRSLQGPKITVKLPPSNETFAIEANQALKNFPVSILAKNKKNFFSFRNGMLMVIKNTKIGGENLLDLAYIEDAEAKTKIKNLEGRDLKLFQYANDSAIIMIAKCLESRLGPKHDEPRYSYQIWEMLKPPRSVIIAFQAAREIE